MCHEGQEENTYRELSISPTGKYSNHSIIYLFVYQIVSLNNIGT